MFVCHHNDSNTDIYLRRLNAKLEKIIERLDKNHDEYNVEEATRINTFEAHIIVAFTLQQLALLNSGEVYTGIWADITPNIFRNHSSRSFDFYEDAIVQVLIEEHDYTRERANILRATLPQRRDSHSFIRFTILRKIRSFLNNVIQYELMEKIIENNGFKAPLDLKTKIFECRRDDASKVRIINKAIEDGLISDMNELGAYIRKIYEI